MNHPPTVSIVEGAADAPNKVEDFWHGQWLTVICAFFEYLAEVFAFDKDHCHVIITLIFAKLIHPDDIGVMQTGNSACLAPETFRVLSLICGVEIAVDDLHSRITLEPIIVALINAGHASAT